MLRIEGLGKRYRIPRVDRSPQSERRQTRWQRLTDRLSLSSAFDRGGDGVLGMRDIWALKDVTFDVAPGTIVGLIGPNGAGKSTLLKILARVTQPTEGRVAGRGRVVSLIELGAGFDPESSARDNIYMNAALYGIPHHIVDRRFDEIIEFAEMGEFVEAPLKHFSSGMYLRLAFSVAINMEPDILLADEILAVGDESFQTRCLERVEHESRNGLTVLFVSHDMDAISRICSRVIWIAAGRVVRDGSPDEVVTEYQQAAWQAGKSRLSAHGMHANRFGEILDVRLVTTERKEVGAISRNENVFVRIRFRIGPAKLQVRCSIDLYCRGLLVFRSSAPELTWLRRERVFETNVLLPAGLLAETMYIINTNILLVRNDGRELSLQLPKALTFMVYGETGTVDPAPKGAQGLLAPTLTWTKIKGKQTSKAWALQNAEAAEER